MGIFYGQVQLLCAAGEPKLNVYQPSVFMRFS